MATVDRSRFKATPLAVLKESEQEVEVLTGRSGNRADYHTLSPGKNKFRIYPGLDDEPFVFPRSVSWLPFDVEEEKDGQKVKVRKNRTIFNAKVHGGLPMDLVEEYYNYVLKKMGEQHGNNTEAYKKAIRRVTGFREGNKFQNGILPDTKWVCYADKYTGSVKKFGLLEIGKAIKGQMNELSQVEGPTDVITTDPFTDIEIGICLIVDKDANADDPSKYYKCELEQKKVGLTINLIPTPLTDDDLNNFLTYPTLASQFKNSFTERDFKLQLKALQIIDREEAYNCFQDDAFLEVVEKISKLVPEDKSEESSDEPTTSTPPLSGTEKVVMAGQPSTREQLSQQASNTRLSDTGRVVKKYTDDEVKEMDPLLLDREDLKRFISLHDLGIRVTQSMSEEVIIELIQEELSVRSLSQAEDESPFLTKEEEAPAKEPLFNNEGSLKEEAKTETPQERMARLRAIARGESAE